MTIEELRHLKWTLHLFRIHLRALTPVGSNLVTKFFLEETDKSVEIVDREIKKKR
jgi:hypothetical protein